MEFNKNSFIELFKNHKDGIITRIIITPKYFLKTNIAQIDIYNDKLNIPNIIKIIKNNKNNKEDNFVRTVYYSQKKDNKRIYTEEYTFSENFEYKDYNLCISNYTTIDQDVLSFPNLNVYDYTEQINEKIYYCDNFNIIIENKKIFIEFDKYDDNTLDKICDLFIS